MNLFILTIVSIITYSSYVYFPPYVFTMLAFFNVIGTSNDEPGLDAPASAASGASATSHTAL
jgi:hypothetical protein